MNLNSQPWIQRKLEQLESNSLLRELRRRQSPPVAGKIQLNGRQLVNFGSNDYLSIASDFRLVDAVKLSVGYLGVGAGASPLVNGHGAAHERLEKEIADFETCEAALLFTTGFAANVGVITAITGPEDLIFSDQFNHASIIDGCKLSEAKTRVYKHNHLEELNDKLREECSGNKFIVTDSLFSMNGDFARLDELAELAEKHQAMLVVDEAHATGVFGDSGRGLCEHFGIEDRVFAKVGTLSKACGSFGGFVSGSQDLIDLLVNRARTYIFSTAQPEFLSFAAIAALELIKTEPERRQKLLRNADRLRCLLEENGFEVGASCSQIIPAYFGDSEKVMHISSSLADRGFFVPGIRPPAVSPENCMLRFSICTDHTDEMIEGVVAELCDLTN